MALNNNACPICDELSVYYGVAFNAYNMVHGNQPDITLTEDICNKLSMGMPVHICNHGEILMLYPLYETMTGTGQCAYILIGSIGSTSWGIVFGTCGFSNNNKILNEFTASNVIDIY